MIVRHLIEKDWIDVKRIYEEGISTGHATFERSAPEWSSWNGAHVSDCRLVAEEEDGSVVGWAALTPVSDRCVYAGVAAVSIYVSASARGRGVGKALLTNLIDVSEKNNYWTLQAGIFPENEASLRLHQQCGFRIIGSRYKIGMMNGVWRDTVQLERRSDKVGID